MPYVDKVISTTKSADLITMYKSVLHTKDPSKFRPNDSEITYTIKTEITDTYEENILKAKNKIIAVVKQYMNKNSSAYGVRYPLKRIPFLKSDMDILFRAVGIDPKELYDATMKINANDIDVGNHLIQNPFNTLCVIITHVFLKHDKPLLQKIKMAEDKIIPDSEKYKSPVYLVAMYLACYFYSKNYMRYWKYDPTPDVMDYTIEHLSNKYIIKKCSSLMDFIQYHSETNVENMWDRVTRGSDVDIIYFFSNLNNRLSHALRTLANEYYKNKEEDNRTGHDKLTMTNDEGKTSLVDVTNISSDINTTVRRITNSFFSESIIDDKLVTASIYRTKFSKSKFMVILNRIRENKESDPIIYKIIANIIAYYLTNTRKSANTFKSNEFVTTMIKTYGISNTNDIFINSMKDQLTQLVKLNLEGILDETNMSSIDRCRTSIYIYLVLYIAACSK